MSRQQPPCDVSTGRDPNPAFLLRTSKPSLWSFQRIVRFAFSISCVFSIRRGNSNPPSPPDDNSCKSFSPQRLADRVFTQAKIRACNRRVFSTLDFAGSAGNTERCKRSRSFLREKLDCFNCPASFDNPSIAVTSVSSSSDSFVHFERFENQ